jgi:hypothetical protein
MSHNREKMIYSDFKLAKSVGINSNKSSKKSKSLEQRHAKDRGLFDSHVARLSKQKNHSSRSIQQTAAPIHSLPRTILKLSIVGLVFHQGLVHTQIGRSLANNASQKITELQKKIITSLS